MVQIIPRTRKTFVEQLGAGLGGGLEKGMGMAMEQGMAQLGKKTEIANKLKLLEQPEYQEFFKGVDPRLAKLATLAAAGVIDPGVATSMAELIRQGQSDIDFNKALGGMQSEGAQNMKLPDQGERSLGVPEGAKSPMQESPSRKPGKDYESQISNLQNALRYASTPQKRAQVESKIKELQRQQDLDLAQQKIQSEREFIPKKEYIKHAAKENADFLDEVSQVEKDLPNTEFALASITDSLGNANKWAALRDQLAEHTGFEGFRSAAGAELDSAIKNYFLGDLSSIKGGRANVFLEKQIRDAYPKAGRDPIANQKVTIGMQMKEKINRLLVERTREMEKEELKQEFLSPGFKSRVRNSLKKDVEQIEKKAIDTMHHMTTIESSRDKIFRKYVKPGEVLMMDEQGQPFAVPKKEVQSYKDQGYIDLGEK